jgi:hypothetical protein
MKKIIKTTLEWGISIEGNLSQLREQFDKWEKDHRGVVLSIIIHDEYDIRLIGTRVETDEEYKSRLEEEAEIIRQKEERKNARLAKQQMKAANRIVELEKELARLKGQ